MSITPEQHEAEFAECVRIMGNLWPKIRDEIAWFRTKERAKPVPAAECDECDGQGFYYLNDQKQACICSESQTAKPVPADLAEMAETFVDEHPPFSPHHAERYIADLTSLLRDVREEPIAAMESALQFSSCGCWDLIHKAIRAGGDS